MKNLKKLTSVFLAVIMLLAMNTTAFAAVSDTGFSDVAANAWYADAVTYVRGHGLMTAPAPLPSLPKPPPAGDRLLRPFTVLLEALL